MKKLNVSSKLLKVLSIVFFVIGIIYIGIMIKSFCSTISSYTAQGYSFSDVFWYLFEAQLLPSAIEPAAIFGGFGVAFIALANIKDCICSKPVEAPIASAPVVEEPKAEVVEEADEEPKVEVVEEADEEPKAEVVEEADEEPEVEVVEEADEEPEETVDEVGKVFENISYVGTEAKAESSLDNITDVK